MGFSCGAVGWNGGRGLRAFPGRSCGQGVAVGPPVQGPLPSFINQLISPAERPFIWEGGKGSLNLGIKFCGGLGQRTEPRGHHSHPLLCPDLETAGGFGAAGGLVVSGPGPQRQGACAQQEWREALYFFQTVRRLGSRSAGAARSWHQRASGDFSPPAPPAVFLLGW